MTPRDVIRDIDARTAACRNYASAYDRLSTEAQALAAAPNRPLGRRLIANWARITLRAWEAEIKDVKPEGLP